jgi:hypothetical protein
VTIRELAKALVHALNYGVGVLLDDFYISFVALMIMTNLNIGIIKGIILITRVGYKVLANPL